MDQLLLIGAEHAEHRRALAADQAPETAVRRVLVAPDPAAPLQGIEETADTLLGGEPLVDGAPLDAAVVRMNLARDETLALEHVVHLLLQVKAGDHAARADA